MRASAGRGVHCGTSGRRRAASGAGSGVLRPEPSTAPGPHTVAMRITRGEGVGSVVETHPPTLSPAGRAAHRRRLAGRPRSPARRARPVLRYGRRTTGRRML
ncbi:DUF5914 domain-containing protein [Streptomyces murinus]